MERTPQYEKDVLACFKALTGFAIKLTRNHSQAEDLVQDTIIKALTKHEQYQDDSNLKAWLFTILRNEFINKTRRKKRETEDPEGIFASKLTTQPNQEFSYDASLLMRRLRRAPKNMRLAFELIVLNGLQYEEASTIMNTAVGTLKSRVSRIKDFLENGSLIIEDEEPKKLLDFRSKEIIDVQDSYIKGSSVYEIAEEFQMEPFRVMQVLTYHKIRRRLRIDEISLYQLSDYEEDDEVVGLLD